MSGQSGGQRLSLSTLNEHLTCKLCGGYFIDATTIIECLHTFCKTCIVKHFNGNKYCPVCNIQVHKNKPLLNIRPDHIKQDIVYKLVPSCYQNEMRCRKEFYAKHPEERNKVTSMEAKGEPTESYIYSPDESLSLSLEYYSPNDNNETENDKDAVSKYLPRRYLRCPAAVTVFHLQKLIRAKYGLSEAHRVDIMYKEEPLCATYTLMDIMYIHHWKRKVPLHLSYRIFESATKRIKLLDDNDELKQSLSNSNMEMELKDDEQSIKREWKEVQLKISETGVMSVMDISSLDTKNSTKVNETDQPSGNIDQVPTDSCDVNTNEKMEEKEPLKVSTGRGRKAHQDKKNEKLQEEKSNAMSVSATKSLQNNAKNEEMEVKTIDQRDLSNELLKSAAESSNSVKATIKGSSSSNKCQTQTQQSLDKIKTEPASPKEVEKRTESKQQNLTNNNFIGGSEVKTEANSNQSSKTASSAGSKINALSAKLQFQPKVGQVNNTYSKKSLTTTTTEKKRILSSPENSTETKVAKTSAKVDVKSLTSSSPSSQISDSKQPLSSTTTYSQNSLVNTSSVYVTAPSGTTVSTSSHQQNRNVSQSLAPSNESLASMGLHLSISTMSNQANLGNWVPERVDSQKNLPNKAAIVDQQLRSLPGMPPIGKEIVCSTTAASGPPSNAGRLSIQTSSMTIYFSSPSKQQQQQQQQQPQQQQQQQLPTSKANYEVGNLYPVPPCPDAIPISLMKPSGTNMRKDAISKGTTVNEICDKIRSSSKLSTDSSKDKSKIEAQQRGKPEIPELLKISKKNEGPSVSQVKHIHNIPNVPIYTPSNSQHQPMPMGVEVKDSAKRPIAAIAPSSQASIMTAILQQQQQHHHSQQKQMVDSSKQSQSGASYKTLRYPPKSWNPTLSKNNYVAAKNQAKEMQAAYNAAVADGSGIPRQIPSKPPKIFKNKNTPRFLGNPASGVKPMYGAVNEQLKEKDQSNSSSKNSSTMSMTKIDPQTLSPIVSSHSTMASPPPYSPTARSSSYQNSPYQRNNSGAGINSSPRNSPVNMLSTSPFIPSHTPHTNPRIIYYPPATGYGTDASHLSNPLIRAPIQPPSSAFHCSLPPSINKLYQRSSYLTQPQTNVAAAFNSVVAAAAAAGFSPATSAAQISAAQRLQLPNSHSAPQATPPPSSSKASKTSPISASSSSASVNLATTSAASLVDTVALQLAAKREGRSIFDLMRTESAKAQLNSDAKHTMSPPSASHSSASTKSCDASQQKIVSPDAMPRKSPESKVKGASAASSSTTPTKEASDKKDESQAKVNGSISEAMQNSGKPRDGSVEAQAQQAQPVRSSEHSTKNITDKSNKKPSSSPSSPSSSPSKSTSGKGTTTQESADSKTKQTNSPVQSKHENNTVDSGKPGSLLSTSPNNKANTEAQNNKASES